LESCDIQLPLLDSGDTMPNSDQTGQDPAKTTGI